MKEAKLVLEFLKVLIWPALVTFSLIFFRAEIRGLFASLQSMRFPGGAELSWHPLNEKAQRARINEDVVAALPPQQAAEQTVNGGAEQTDEAASAVVRERIVLAEKLVMEQLSTQYGVKIIRQIAIDGRPDLRFDGVIRYQGNITLVEVKYANREEGIRETVEGVMAIFNKAVDGIRPGISRGLMVLVVDMPEVQRKKVDRWVTALVKRKYSRHGIRVYGFEELKELYAN